jgi:hypothetical protein
MTPYDKLKSLPSAKDYLKPGLSFGILDKLVHRISDNQAAVKLQKARRKLFKTIRWMDSENRLTGDPFTLFSGSYL